MIVSLHPDQVKQIAKITEIERTTRLCLFNLSTLSI